MTFPPIEEQLRVIRRGVVDLVEEAELIERLRKSAATGEPLRVKLGIDPSSPDIHVGHTVPLRKLRDFQRLGHQVIVLWGTSTAMVGDPSGRDKTRPQLTKEQVDRNKETYKSQIGQVLDLDRIEERENGEWFERMSFMDGVTLASRYTVAQLLERDSFAKRYAQGLPISVHELIYPLMQGWDSVELQADVELGGSDQLFNLMVGRELQRQREQSPQICITMPLIEGLDGSQKMSKSLGNYIGITDSATEMFGKTMSVPDALMEKFFTLLTDVDEAQVAVLLGGHPREAKVHLARSLVASYHGEEAAERAASEFDRMFRGGGLPDDVPRLEVAAQSLRDGALALAACLREIGFAKSNGEGRRLIGGGGVRIDGTVVDDVNHNLEPGEYLVQVGKRRVARVTVPRP